MKIVLQGVIRRKISVEEFEQLKQVLELYGVEDVVIDIEGDGEEDV